MHAYANEFRRVYRVYKELMLCPKSCAIASTVYEYSSGDSSKTNVVYVVLHTSAKKNSKR